VIEREQASANTADLLVVNTLLERASTVTSLPTLNKVHTDLQDTQSALATYWSRGASDLDYKAADLHMAVEALMRATASLTAVVERLAGAQS